MANPLNDQALIGDEMAGAWCKLTGHTFNVNPHYETFSNDDFEDDLNFEYAMALSHPDTSRERVARIVGELVGEKGGV